ncbi:MAG: hypothetical protein HXY49_10270 [Ignavibacteriaceae bacterium]|nr:hypothetical protein [Ignavibacteriaceae bacterium]
MYLVRDVFRTKPGMAKELVKKFKQVFPHMHNSGFNNPRIMTDAIAGYWTVVLEGEVESLAVFEKQEGFTSKPEVREIMKGYLDLVETGFREIYKLE